MPLEDYNFHFSVLGNMAAATHLETWDPMWNFLFLANIFWKIQDIQPLIIFKIQMIKHLI